VSWVHRIPDWFWYGLMYRADFKYEAGTDVSDLGFLSAGKHLEFLPHIYDYGIF
jgi:hypothetical protein